MTAKLISLAGLLLMLITPAYADPPAQAALAPATGQAQGNTGQAAPQPQRLAWQRVGAPLSLEG